MIANSSLILGAAFGGVLLTAASAFAASVPDTLLSNEKPWGGGWFRGRAFATTALLWSADPSRSLRMTLPIATILTTIGSGGTGPVTSR
jgi:hypothetical protein